MRTLGLKEYVAVGAGLFVIALLFSFGGLSLPGFSEEGTANVNNSNNESSVPAGAIGIEDTVIGEGAEALSGKTVSIHYELTLADGTVADASRPRGEPLSFMLGTGAVIPGFDQGVTGMKVGGKRKITIPPELGYGANQVGPIPPNSTLYFEVELLEVR